MHPSRAYLATDSGNWIGNKRWVDTLKWSQRESFDAAPEERWEIDGSVAGSIKEWGPLSFVKLFNAGHMVGLPPHLSPHGNLLLESLAAW